MYINQIVQNACFYVYWCRLLKLVWRGLQGCDVRSCDFKLQMHVEEYFMCVNIQLAFTFYIVNFIVDFRTVESGQSGLQQILKAIFNAM